MSTVRDPRRPVYPDGSRGLACYGTVDTGDFFLSSFSSSDSWNRAHAWLSRRKEGQCQAAALACYGCIPNVSHAHDLLLSSHQCAYLITSFATISFIYPLR